MQDSHAAQALLRAEKSWGLIYMSHSACKEGTLAFFSTLQGCSRHPFKGQAISKRKGFHKTSPYGFCLLSPSRDKKPSPRVGFNLLFLVWMHCRDDSFSRRVSSKPQARTACTCDPTHVIRWMGNLRVHVDLPVGLACDIKPAEVALVILGVSTSQDQLTTRLT